MRKDSPAVYACPKGKNGLHHWRLFKRVDTDKPGCPVIAASAVCTKCDLKVQGQDALDLATGAEL